MKNKICLFIIVLCVIIVCVLYAQHRTQNERTIYTTRFGAITVSGAGNIKGAFILLISDGQKEETDLSNVRASIISQGNVLAEISHRAIVSEGEVVPCYEIAGELIRLSQIIQSDVGMEVSSPPVLLGYGDASSRLLSVVHPFIDRQVSDSFLIFASEDGSSTDPRCSISDTVPLSSTSQQHSIVPTSDNMHILVAEQLSKRQNAFLPCDQNQCRLTERARAYIDTVSHQIPIIEEIPEAFSVPYFVIFISGDGGWATIDKEITSYLKKNGVPVIGVDSLKYFWKKKDPEILSVDMRKLIVQMQNKLGIRRYILIGFSLGANMVPFVITRLDETLRQDLLYFSLLNPTKKTEFEIHFTDWIPGSVPETGASVQDEIRKLVPTPGSCIRGSEETDSACILPQDFPIEQFIFEGSHHYNGNYDAVSKTLFSEFSKHSIVR